MVENKKLTIVLVVVLIANIYIALNFKLVYGMGKSMKPTFSEKELLLCKKSKEYKENDIVFYKIDGRPVVHRIVSKHKQLETTYYQTKGDGNKFKDAFMIYEENIICKIKER